MIPEICIFHAIIFSPLLLMVADVPGKELVSMFLSLSKENMISKIIKIFLSRKKTRALLTHEEDKREELIASLRKIKDTKIIDLDNDLACIIPANEIDTLVKLKENDAYQFKIIFYPIAKRFYNTILKYFHGTKRIIFVSSDIELLSFLGLNCPKKIIHAVSNPIVIEQMTKNHTRFIDINQDSAKDVQNDFKKVLKIKRGWLPW